MTLGSTCSWCVVSVYTWLALWLSLVSTCSWCVVSALAPLSCGSRRIIQVDAAHWWWLRRDPPRPTWLWSALGVQYTIKALYKCIIHSFIILQKMYIISLTIYLSIYIYVYKIKILYIYIYIYIINAILFNLLFIRESWKNASWFLQKYGIKQQNCFQHW